ncbi:hypothetical protein ACFY1P_18825 [Streptomyces sp. NPDC001407]|uniref:hypothetical protein n=1 Tax=unclassified Streptomyces TaxID=2593676 RepID=UPI0033C0F223
MADREIRENPDTPDTAGTACDPDTPGGSYGPETYGSGPVDASGDTRSPEDESDAERRRRRAQFLRELNEAKELRDRVQPRRARAARMRQQMRMRTFRW